MLVELIKPVVPEMLHWQQSALCGVDLMYASALGTILPPMLTSYVSAFWHLVSRLAIQKQRRLWSDMQAFLSFNPPHQPFLSTLIISILQQQAHGMPPIVMHVLL